MRGENAPPAPLNTALGILMLHLRENRPTSTCKRSEQPRLNHLFFTKMGFPGQADGHAHSCLVEVAGTGWPAAKLRAMPAL